MGYLTRDPLPFPLTAQTGAFVTFLGIVRADVENGRTVTALTYEAYPEMAEAQIHQLLLQVRRLWALTHTEIRHRIGYIPAGEAALFVATGASHRADAYAGSQWLIDRIKQDVPIWKQTHYSDGSCEWSHGCAAKEPSHALL